MMHGFYNSDLWNFDPASRKSMILRIGDTVPFTMLFELWKTWCFAIFDSAEKRLIPVVQAAKNVLQHLRINTFIPRTFDFQLGQLILLLVVGNYCSIFFISFDPFFQIPVIQMSAHRKLIFQVRHLCLGWVDAVLERFLDQQFHMGCNTKN